MNVLQLVLTLALVAGGLVVYDTVVADRGPPVTTQPITVEAPAPPTPAATQPERPMRVELHGAGLQALIDRVDALEARLDEALDAAPRPRAPGASPEEGGTYPAPEAFRVEDLAEGEELRFDERDLAWFRAMKDEVDRRQRQERFEQMVANQLDRTGVVLSDEQRKGVLAATLEYRAGIRAAYRQPGFSQQPTEDRQQTLEELRASYEQTLYTLVPSSDADRILEQMGRFPGMSARRFGPGGQR